MTLYLRPLGLFPDAAAHETVLPLSNTGLAFGLVEVIERQGENTTRAFVPVQALKEKAATNAEIAGLLHNLISPRAAWAGLPLDQTRIMGILNVTPDSFSDGGQFFDCGQAVQQAQKMIAQGADIIDVGGESTRPNAMQPDEAEELRRVIPVIEKISSNVVVSTDTRRAAVMEQAVAAGAVIVNDISALTYDPAALNFIAQNNIPVVLMHMQGTPQTMQDNPRYDHAALDVHDYLKERISACERAGLSRANIIIDPGIGFGKTLDHNLQILSHLSLFHGLGCGILIGVSRKSFIGKLNDNADAQNRLPGSLAGAVYAVSQGVQILRVHDVVETRQALHIWECTRGL